MNVSYGDEGNNYQGVPETPYYGGKINAYSNNEVDTDEVSPNPPTNDVNINANSNDERNYYEVTPDTPTKDGNNETIDNDKEKITKKRLRRKQTMKT